MNDYELLFSLDDDDACEFCNEITASGCYLAQTKDVLLLRDQLFSYLNSSYRYSNNTDDKKMIVNKFLQFL